MQKIFWYAAGKQVHAVFASHKSIAKWYADTSPFMRGAKFVKEDTRSATERESTTVLAHAADRTLRDCYKEWCANGGSVEYREKLARLLKHVAPLPSYLTYDEE